MLFPALEQPALPDRGKIPHPGDKCGLDGVHLKVGIATVWLMVLPADTLT
jgi:hypothetical protein